jgi:hypothetical protein
MAHVFVVKIEDQIGLHMVRVEEEERLEQVLALYGVESGTWKLIENRADDDRIPLNCILSA